MFLTMFYDTRLGFFLAVSKHRKFAMANNIHVTFQKRDQVENLFQPFLNVVCKRERWPIIGFKKRYARYSKDSQSSYLGKIFLLFRRICEGHFFFCRNQKILAMVKVNQQQEKPYNLCKMKQPNEKINFIASFLIILKLPSSFFFQFRNKKSNHSVQYFVIWLKVAIKVISILFLLCTNSLSNSDKIDRNRFRDILHNTFDMTDDILMDRGNDLDIKISIISRYQFSKHLIEIMMVK